MKRKVTVILPLLLLCLGLTACGKQVDHGAMPLETAATLMMTEVSETGEPDASISAPQQEPESAYWDTLPNKAFFDAQIRSRLQRGSYSEALGFLMYDLNGDGADDLLIGRDGYIMDVYSGSEQLVDSTVTPNCYAYLCQGNVLVKVQPFGETVGFYQIENGELTWLKTIRHEFHEEESWTVGDPENPLQWRGGGREITQAEYQAIWDSYPRICMDFLPLSQYPLDGAVTQPENNPPMQEFESYDQIVQSRLAEAERKPFTYALIDLDGNGQDEFYLDRVIQQDIYTIANGKVKMLWATLDDVLCQNGIIRERRVYNGDNVAYIFHRITGENVKRVDYLRYDADKNSEDPWFRSSDATGQDITMESISQAEFQAILESYQPVVLNLKPLKDYPMD